MLIRLSPIRSRYFFPAPGFPCATVAMRCSAGITFRSGSASAHSIATFSSRGSIESGGTWPMIPMRVERGLP